MNFLPRRILFCNGIPIDSLMIPNSNVTLRVRVTVRDLVKRFLATIFSVIVYYPFDCSTKESGPSENFIPLSICEVRSNGVRASIAVVQLLKFSKMYKTIDRSMFFL